MYALNTTQLVNHGIIQAELNQRHILSDPSIKRLSSTSLVEPEIKSPLIEIIFLKKQLSNFKVAFYNSRLGFGSDGR